MADDDQAKEAIAALDSNDFMGRDLRVNEARPREPRQAFVKTESLANQ